MLAGFLFGLLIIGVSILHGYAELMVLYQTLYPKEDEFDRSYELDSFLYCFYDNYLTKLTELREKAHNKSLGINTDDIVEMNNNHLKILLRRRKVSGKV